ncbi:hypothetical protein F4779DRAFT_570340 [Xylariaceae sp. FL0662B]|nr:hypothetical protein F4779DRAFT_570340 [Xylariaceae sp. FL0662B]
MQSPDRIFRTPGSSQIDLSMTQNETFATRFSQLLNSYWSAVYGVDLMFQGQSTTLSYDINTFWFSDPLANVTGTNTQIETQFVYDRGWMAALIISTCVMFASGVIKLVFDLCISIPDLKMNASTLLRGGVLNCPSLPLGGAAMDDTEGSKLLYDQRVRFGNISTEDGHIGELGIGEPAECQGKVTEVKSNMSYR